MHNSSEPRQTINPEPQQTITTAADPTLKLETQSHAQNIPKPDRVLWNRSPLHPDYNSFFQQLPNLSKHVAKPQELEFLGHAQPKPFTLAKAW